MLDWNEKSKNIAKDPSCFMKMSGGLWVCPVGRRCSVCMNLGAEGASLGQMQGILGLTARQHSKPWLLLKTALEIMRNLDL